MGQSPSSKNYTDNPNDDILVQGNADLKDGKVVPRLWTKEITKTIDQVEQISEYSLGHKERLQYVPKDKQTENQSLKQ